MGNNQTLLENLERANVKKLKQLISKSKVDIHNVDKVGNSALHFAVSKQNIELIVLLIDYGADVNHVDQMDQESPLIWAARLGNCQVTQELLMSGADVNLSNTSNRTPLMESVIYKHAEQVELLLNWGANPNLQDAINKKSALHQAVQNGSESIVKELLAYNADTKLKDQTSRIPIDLCKSDAIRLILQNPRTTQKYPDVSLQKMREQRTQDIRSNQLSHRKQHSTDTAYENNDSDGNSSSQNQDKNGGRKFQIFKSSRRGSVASQQLGHQDSENLEDDNRRNFKNTSNFLKEQYRKSQKGGKGTGLVSGESTDLNEKSRDAKMAARGISNFNQSSQELTQSAYQPNYLSDTDRKYFNKHNRKSKTTNDSKYFGDPKLEKSNTLGEFETSGYLKADKNHPHETQNTPPIQKEQLSSEESSTNPKNSDQNNSTSKPLQSGKPNSERRPSTHRDNESHDEFRLNLQPPYNVNSTDKTLYSKDSNLQSIQDAELNKIKSENSRLSREGDYDKDVAVLNQRMVLNKSSSISISSDESADVTFSTPYQNQPDKSPEKVQTLSKEARVGSKRFSEKFNVTHNDTFSVESKSQLQKSPQQKKSLKAQKSIEEQTSATSTPRQNSSKANRTLSTDKSTGAHDSPVKVPKLDTLNTGSTQSALSLAIPEEKPQNLKPAASLNKTGSRKTPMSQRSGDLSLNKSFQVGSGYGKQKSEGRRQQRGYESSTELAAKNGKKGEAEKGKKEKEGELERKTTRNGSISKEQLISPRGSLRKEQSQIPKLKISKGEKDHNGLKQKDETNQRSGPLKSAKDDSQGSDTENDTQQKVYSPQQSVQSKARKSTIRPKVDLKQTDPPRKRNSLYKPTISSIQKSKTTSPPGSGDKPSPNDKTSPGDFKPKFNVGNDRGSRVLGDRSGPVGNRSSRVVEKSTKAGERPSRVSEKSKVGERAPTMVSGGRDKDSVQSKQFPRREPPRTSSFYRAKNYSNNIRNYGVQDRKQTIQERMDSDLEDGKDSDTSTTAERKEIRPKKKLSGNDQALKGRKEAGKGVKASRIPQKQTVKSDISSDDSDTIEDSEAEKASLNEEPTQVQDFDFSGFQPIQTIQKHDSINMESQMKVFNMRTSQDGSQRKSIGEEQETPNLRKSRERSDSQKSEQDSYSSKSGGLQAKKNESGLNIRVDPKSGQLFVKDQDMGVQSHDRIENQFEQKVRELRELEKSRDLNSSTPDLRMGSQKLPNQRSGELSGALNYQNGYADPNQQNPAQANLLPTHLPQALHQNGQQYGQQQDPNQPQDPYQHPSNANYYGQGMEGYNGNPHQGAGMPYGPSEQPLQPLQPQYSATANAMPPNFGPPPPKLSPDPTEEHDQTELANLDRQINALKYASRSATSFQPRSMAPSPGGPMVGGTERPLMRNQSTLGFLPQKSLTPTPGQEREIYQPYPMQTARSFDITQRYSTPPPQSFGPRPFSPSPYPQQMYPRPIPQPQPQPPQMQSPYSRFQPMPRQQPYPHSPSPFPMPRGGGPPPGPAQTYPPFGAHQHQQYQGTYRQPYRPNPYAQPNYRNPDPYLRQPHPYNPHRSYGGSAWGQPNPALKRMSSSMNYSSYAYNNQFGQRPAPVMQRQQSTYGASGYPYGASYRDPRPQGYAVRQPLYYR